MPLPTVLMTDVIRSAQQGNAHGGAYLINLESGDFTKVLDWNRVDIEWEGRGMGRGLRGIVFLGDEVWIAASDELFVFDRSFNILRSYKCPALHHCHEITRDDQGRIYLTSTSFDSILRFDPAAERFDAAWYIAPATRTIQGKPATVLAAKAYDPHAERLPPKQDRLHINQVWCTPQGVLFSGLRFKAVCVLNTETAEVRPYAVVPEMTHNCQPHQGRIIYNSTGDDAVVIAGLKGAVIQRMPIPRIDPKTIENPGVPGDYARAGFARGLCVDEPSGTIIAGHSPGSVTAFDLRTGKPARTVTVARDIRNAPHGLEVWPHGDAVP
ncbi:MAG: hypothetical protein LAT64_03825 [Phycisphaerales bacterium]|nr:hypothetical protein [Planctomycetota bacterium]MCH8507880.1 hypothetical protein [Phycisphaerales bacterium]